MPAAPMPAHSPDERGAEILQRIRPSFARKGFDGASMQDLARAAGISVGSFYRHFPSKAAIVEALVHQDIAAIERMLQAIEAASDPRTALRAALHARIAAHADDDARLWLEISAASMRRSDIAEACRCLEQVIEAKIVEIFSRIGGLEPGVCKARFGAQARLLLLFMRAALSRPAGEDDAALDALVLAELDRLIDAVPAALPAGG